MGCRQSCICTFHIYNVVLYSPRWWKYLKLCPTFKCFGIITVTCKEVPRTLSFRKCYCVMHMISKKDSCKWNAVFVFWKAQGLNTIVLYFVSWERTEIYLSIFWQPESIRLIFFCPLRYQLYKGYNIKFIAIILFLLLSQGLIKNLGSCTSGHRVVFQYVHAMYSIWHFSVLGIVKLLTMAVWNTLLWHKLFLVSRHTQYWLAILSFFKCSFKT